MTSADRVVSEQHLHGARRAGAGYALALLLVFVGVISSCTERTLVQPELPEEPEEPDSTDWNPAPVGLFKFTLTGIGTPEMTGTVAQVNAASDPTPVPLASLAFQQISAGGFMEGTRGVDGVRYINFVYRVGNTTGAPMTNLTLITTSTTGTIAGTPFSVVNRYDGTAAAPALAQKIVPTGAVALGPDGSMTATHPDVLQAYTEAEVAAIPLPAGATGAFPYGFVVRNSRTGGRTLPARVDANDYTGLVNLTFRVPLQATSAQDAFTVVFWVMAIQDDVVRLTESIEEGGDTAAVRRLRERATQIGATMVTVLNGSGRTAPGVLNYPGQRQLCTLRTAGTSGSPLTFVHEPGAFSHLMLRLPGESLSSCDANFRSGTAGRPATNVEFPMTVIAMDRYGNVKTSRTDQFRLEQTGAPATLPGPENLVSGSRAISVTYTDYGTSNLSVITSRALGWQTIPVAGVTRTWTAGAGTTSWHTGANWADGAEPMALDSVIVPAAPAGGAIFPVTAANVAVQGVTVEDGATITIGSFDLTAGGNVATGLSGGISGSVGRVILTGTARTVRGVLPRIRVTGTYSLDGNLTARTPVRVEAGRLRNQSFRIRGVSQ